MKFRTLLLAIFLGGSVSAQEVDPQIGRDLFLTHCWQCHGMDAKGDGPMAEMLAIRTPDLTEMAVRNGGVFPLEEVARQIDGRDALLSHGGEMPIFGPFLASDQRIALRLPSGQSILMGMPLANVIAYLERLQTE